MYPRARAAQDAGTRSPPESGRVLEFHWIADAASLMKSAIGIERTLQRNLGIPS